jgi:4-O-beta-D-mannosyl-D-glucose phosphorylase
MNDEFKRRLAFLESQQEEMLNRKNELLLQPSGVFARYKHPVLTAMHTPLTWRYDLDPLTNPYLLERFTINATLNPGAVKWFDKYVLVARVEGADRKSFFAVAESLNGIDQFRFHPYPILMP